MATGDPDRPMVPLDVSEALEQDAYRQGLVDAAKAMCKGCFFGQEHFGVNTRKHVSRFAGCEHLDDCAAWPIHNLIAAHDKEVSNENG